MRASFVDIVKSLTLQHALSDGREAGFHATFSNLRKSFSKIGLVYKKCKTIPKRVAHVSRRFSRALMCIRDMSF